MTPLRVMIVHPEASVARRLADLVVRAGHAPIVVPDGERAIDRFVQEPVEVVVVEYFLPGRDGVTTVESIRWAPKGREVKVLLLADAEPEVAPLAALGARIDAVETLVGDPDDARFAAALEATLRLGSAPRPAPVVSFDDDTATGQPPETILSKSAATRFDDESTVQGSATVARSILLEGTGGPEPLRGEARTAPALDASLALAKKTRAQKPREEDIGTRVAKRTHDPLEDESTGASTNASTGASTHASTGEEWRRDPGTVAEAKEVREHARRAEGSDVTNTGRFEDLPFPALLTRLADAKTSGALICKAAVSARETTNGDAPTKVVYFRSGVPTFVRSNLLDECLGQLLLRQKRIGKATLEESVRRMLRGDGRQGEILMELGAVAPMVLSEALATQAREKLYDLFGWQRGSWRLSPNLDAPRDGTQLELGLSEIVYEGVCAAMPATRLLDVLTPSLDLYPVPSADRLSRFARVRVPSELRPILERLDGTEPLRALLNSGGRPGAVAQLVYALHCLGAVRFDARPARRAPGRAPDPLGSSQEFAPRVTRALEAAPRHDPVDPEWDDETSRQGRGSKAAPRSQPRSDPPARTAPTARRDEATGGERPTKRPPRPSAAPGPDAGPGPPVPAPMSAAPIAAAVGAVQMGPPPDVKRPAPVASAAGAVSMGPPPHAQPSAPVLPAPAPTASATPAPDLDARVDRLFEAERHFRRGSRALERGKLDDALGAFLRAAELCPAEGEFLAYVGWARSVSAPGDDATTDAALRELAQASDLSPGLYVTHLLHARLLERSRRTGEARRAYERVLAIEPSNAEAVAAVARLT